MLFGTAQFAIFLAALLLLLRLLPRRAWNGVLLGASLVFYSLWIPAILPLLLADIGINYVLLRRMLEVRAPACMRIEMESPRNAIRQVFGSPLPAAIFSSSGESTDRRLSPTVGARTRQASSTCEASRSVSTTATAKTTAQRTPVSHFDRKHRLPVRERLPYDRPRSLDAPIPLG